MTAIVYAFVRAASDGWGDRGTIASFGAGAALLAAFVTTEKRAEQPITRCACSPTAPVPARTSRAC